MTKLMSSLLMIVFAAGCSPTIQKQRDVDLNSGFTKSIDFLVRKKLSKNVAFKARFFKADGQNFPAVIDQAEDGQVTLKAIGSDEMKQGEHLNYNLETSYSWPLFGFNGTSLVEGAVEVGSAPLITSAQAHFCSELEQDQSVALNLAPPPEREKIPMNVMVTGVPLEISVAYSELSGSYNVSSIGRVVGTSTVILNVNRSTIAPLQLTYLTVPTQIAPMNLASRGALPADNALPPPDIDTNLSIPLFLSWSAKPGALRYTVQIFNSKGNRVIGSLVKGTSGSYIAWLPAGTYSWWIRAEVQTCSGEKIWTDFSSKNSFVI